MAQAARYRDAATKGFLRNYAKGLRPVECGAEDYQANCMTRVGVMVAMYAGSPQLHPLVETATRTTQNMPEAAAHAQAAANILDKIVRGLDPLAAVVETVQEFSADGRRAAICLFTGLGSLGQPLPLPPISRSELQKGVAAKLDEVLVNVHMPVKEFVDKVGRNCHM